MASYILVNIVSGNGLSSVRHQATTWTNAELPVLSIGLLGRKFSEMLDGIQTFPPRKCVRNCRQLGAVSIRKTVLPGMAIPMLKIRRPNGRLIFNIGIAIRR